MRAIVWTLIAVSLPQAALAQEVFKCFDSSSVTYTNTPCEKLGLKPGGEIRDMLTTVPAFKYKKKPLPDPAAATAAAAAGGPPGAKSDAAVEMPKGTGIKPVNPMIDKLSR